MNDSFGFDSVSLYTANPGKAYLPNQFFRLGSGVAQFHAVGKYRYGKHYHILINNIITPPH
jgi:hypothetical protein